MYFAVAQAMAAELSTGALVMREIQRSGKKVSMLVANNNGTYTKKAVGTITFTCEEAHKNGNAHLYVAIWFYLPLLYVAVLHNFNSLEINRTMVVRTYAVAFFLTTPFLGLMYYYLPKIANRPVYSYRLSIVHFWSLIFLYIWAGPHHLLYSALPEWAQNLGVVFSIMLIAPSWGGMINGLLTLRGAWDKVRTEPILKFFVVAITGYGMATFEGPMLSLKNVNAIAHYTDWIVAHVHVGALGHGMDL
ncbi:hypothetical protein FQR65_LT19802 [Abscondita terminalis]|nr:hypothetical protein FQR65_LT19802 [Abscondita terminalis]